jgi:type II secretory ATPase GspE/PulE/Tfp pilus assembly ATPase PilB-like protein
VGLYELLEVNSRLRNAILAGSEFEIREAAQSAGLVSMTRQAVDLALAGDLSVREAYRTCYFGGD